MRIVYLLQHSYETGYKFQYTETKIIGIYSLRKIAEQKIEEYLNLPGFCKFNRDTFYIDEYEIDKDHWAEGFISWEET